MTRHRTLGDEGSVLPLTVGYALLAVVLVLVAADAISLALAHKRADTVADAAALAASDGFVLDVDGGGAHARLDPATLAELAAEVVAASGEVTLIAADTPDGLSARVTVATIWRPPISSLFVPDGVRLESSATSRVVLR
ncbi:pilus assembly protein TadG-related protein [Microbacterium sp. cf332]|uniref:pilus assembly protein TadG-related protein n=1 Tax=Microbacterium sp. cf332 TaxID=1761804 RepID=UPI00087E4D77|nr:pilus assembly protein TadG-related protein [Microbacterium sp. cf332]SDQ13456.1 hypothetical protein SAMN04487847_0530 [Microbacterium sp. cf332]